mmetsp:Transcript_37106/g.106868  ORF Transcript_37106/g.106868 Transcript_37106/m.106868 type:complete len:131 (-) Transcript_37106:4835-5227(-)
MPSTNSVATFGDVMSAPHVFRPFLDPFPSPLAPFLEGSLDLPLLLLSVCGVCGLGVALLFDPAEPLDLPLLSANTTDFTDSDMKLFTVPPLLEALLDVLDICDLCDLLRCDVGFDGVLDEPRIAGNFLPW